MQELMQSIRGFPQAIFMFVKTLRSQSYKDSIAFDDMPYTRGSACMSADYHNIGHV